MTLGHAGISGPTVVGYVEDDFEDAVPFALTLSGAVGWDSNMSAAPDDEHDSAFLQGGIAAEYAQKTRRTQIDLGADFGYTYYLDPAPGFDDHYYSARVSMNIRHRVNERLTIRDGFYVAYEFEPNYSIGETTSRRTDQYLYFYNDVSVAYNFNPRWTSVTNWTITGIDYDDDDFSHDDRLTNIFTQQFAYSLSRVTALTMDYRFRITDYDSGFNDFVSHYVLAGINHSFSRNLGVTLRAGAEFRDYDNHGDNTSPYVEGSLVYKVSKLTHLNWYHRLGLDANEMGSFDEHFAYRTGVTANHQFNRQLSGSAGVHYVHSEFSGSPFTDDLEEDLFSLGLSLNYNFWRNFSVYSRYHFTIVDSGNPFREYDRHRVTLGVNATF